MRQIFVALLCVLSSIACAQDPARIRVKVFPGAQNLPLFAGLAKGLFAKRGVAVELLFTVNSTELRDGLANGDIEVAHAAVDNSVAMVELAGKDTVIVMGGDSSMNELFVQGNIASAADLRGRTVIVDARFNHLGFGNVLALRAEVEGQWGGKPPAPDRFIDLGYYERALALAGK